MRAALLLSLCVGTVGLGAQTKHVAALRKGITRLAVPTGAVPGGVCAFGKDAFVVFTAAAKKQRLPLIAAAVAGKGRVVVCGHGSYAGRHENDSIRTLQENVLTWLGHAEPKSVRLLGRGAGGFVAVAKAKGWSVVRGFEGLDDAAAGTVLVLLNSNVAEEHFPSLQKAVRNGAGLITFGPGWGWLQLNKGKTLARDHRANRLLHPFGLAIGDGTVGKVDTDAKFLPGANAHRALGALQAFANGQARIESAQLQQLSAAVEHALGVLQLDSQHPFAATLRKLLSDKQARGPQFNDPVKRTQPVRRLAVRLAHKRRMRQLPKQRAAPEAADFPGVVLRAAKRVAREVEIDLAVPGWHSLGLYANAGSEVTLTLPESLDRPGFALRIGCHKDRLWHKPDWQRSPDVTVEVPIRKKTTSLASAFGGLVYLVVPRGKAGKVSVKVVGAMSAPLFVLGTTDPKAWPAIRDYPGFWAELHSGKVVLTVPSALIRQLEDPVKLLEHWNKALDCYAELSSRPLDARPQRIVADRQISAGYMHAGYPIMTHLDAAKRMVDVELLTTKGDWGLWHELGHNHQQRDWTFGGTGEVTCNLFTLFCMERFTGVAPKDHDRTTKQLPFVMRHVARKAPFDIWKRKPFLALYMYTQLQREFGWEAFQKVFGEYRDLPRGERPKNDAEKRDQWMIRFSRMVGKNLGPFFVKWGVPTSKKARDSIADLPAWMPKEFKKK